MTVSRWIIAGAFLTGGVAMLGALPTANSDGRLVIALLTGQVLVIGAAALAPAVVPPLTWLAREEWSRTRARCHRFGWSVSPARSPNPACQSSRHRALRRRAGGLNH